jgi:RNA polymerase sigma-70 factor (ECF subfamily)
MLRQQRDPEDPAVARDLVVAGVGRVAEDALAADEPMSMDEDSFRAFYDLTARAVWAYLSHVTGDPHAADDLLQETYIRFLGANRRWESDAHRRNFLFRVATNLAHDRHRRNRLRRTEPLEEGVASRGGAARGGDGSVGADAHRAHAASPPSIDAESRTDLRRALERLSARERELLWLAYAEGSSHREIGEALGLRVGGIRVLLFRARRKLAALLRGTGTVRP